MAESLVGKIASNRGKQWSRNTVADGNWLNSNTIQKFNENDITLAEAIESVSAAMEHFTPEITPSAWPCAANKTIQNIEQNADGSLNVTYQPIESSSTSDESLWSLFYQNEYDNVLATYSEIEADINHKAGALSENLTIPAGIYDVKIEVLYKPTQGIINNKLDIAISPTTNIADALYQTFILFDDTLNNDDYQSQWITGIIDLTEGESTTLKFLIKGESAQGRYKLNHIYINSIGGAAGPAGPEGPQGPQGPTGPQGIGLSADSSVSEYGHYVDIWKQGASQYDTRFEVRDGQDGKSLSAEYVEDSEHRQTQVKIGQIDGAEQTSFNLPWGADGHTPEIEIDPTTKEWMIDDVSTGVVAKGQDGANGISLSAKSSTVGNVHTVEIWQEGASTAQTSFNVVDGADGDDGRTPEFQIDLSNAHWQWKYTDEQNWKDTNVVASGTQGPKGNDGDKGDQGDKGDTGNAGADGITPSGSCTPKTEGGVDGTEVSFKYSSTGTDPRDFSFFVPNGQSTGATQILGGNGIEAVKAQGEEKYTISFSGGNFQNLSAYSAERARAYFDPTQNTEVNFYDAFNNVYPKTETSSRSELTTEFGKYLQDISISTDSGWSNVPYLSGNGENQPLGIHNQYTNAWNDKTHVSIDTATNEIKLERNSNSAISAMTYIANESHAGWEPQKSCVCQESEIFAMSQLANGQGMLFFVVSAHN